MQAKEPAHAALREVAEKLLSAKHVETEGYSAQELQVLIHELSVHQIEIKLQNEELIHTQHQLQQSYQDYNQLYEFAPVAYLCINLQGGIERFNQRFAEWVGLSKLKPNTLPLAQFIDPNSLLLWKTWLHSNQRCHNSCVLQLKPKASLVPRWVKVHAVEQPNRDTSPMLMIALTDISDLIQAEDQLSLAATVFEASHEGFMIVDANLRIRLINKAFTRITGYKKDEIIGSTPKFLNSGHHSEAFFREFWHQLNKHNHWEGEIWNKHKDGSIAPHWLSVSITRDLRDRPHRYIALYQDISQRKAQEEMILHQATHDFLTGLYNRSYFYQCLEQWINKVERSQRKLVLMMLDLDGFKEINDSVGHDAGDHVLKEVGRRLQLCVRKADVVARLGGDEFTLLLEMSSHDNTNLSILINKILNELNKPIIFNNKLLHCSSSIGIASYPEHAQIATELQSYADQALYAAKRQGKNTACYYQPSMQEASRVKQQLNSEICQALKNQEFVIHYQPIIKLSDQSIVKTEALIRWQHPQRGIISPDEFIPLAEENGLIKPLGDWIFQQVCHDLQQLSQAQTPCQFSINLAATQLRSLSEEIQTLIQQLCHQKLNQHVVIELTERMLIDTTQNTNGSLQLLRDANIEIALDDFGTGYSSLSYLQEFAIDYIKIDKSFIKNLSREHQSYTLCEAIVAMAHKLDIKVIAEGIETEKQHRLLQEMGCDFGQGYFFHQPMPRAQLEHLLLTHHK